jgi:hypothetical protein
MQPSEDAGLTEDFIIPIPSLTAASSPGIVYVSFTRESPDGYAMASFQCGMKFVSKEVDPSTGEPEEEGFEDEYQLEEVELSASEYIVPSYASFQSEWDRLTAATATETFALSAMESIKGIFDGFLSFDTCAEHASSCVRLYHRITQHGASRRLGESYIHLSAYAATFWSRHWWCWQSVGSLPYDVRCGSRCHA